jgi:hypothetical protein
MYINNKEVTMKYIHILLIPFLLLCSCPYEEEAEVPSNSSVKPAEPSIIDCPVEDLEKKGKYPLPEFDPPPRGPDAVGGCAPSALELSAEELSFNAQGEVRCITSRSLKSVSGKNCYDERILRFPDGSTFIGTRQEFKDFFGDVRDNWGASELKRLVCPWFTATNVDIWSEGRRTLHISVNKNETGNKREASVRISLGNCSGGFKITQSP